MDEGEKAFDWVRPEAMARPRASPLMSVVFECVRRNRVRLSAPSAEGVGPMPCDSCGRVINHVAVTLPVMGPGPGAGVRTGGGGVTVCVTEAGEARTPA